MFTHTSLTISLQSITTWLSHIRFPSSPSTVRKKPPLNQPLNRTMYPAHKVQHNLVAHQTAKSQQAGPRRPHHHPHLQQNSDRPLAGRACALSETPRKLYSQDRTVRKNAVMEVTRTPISRRPLQEIRSNAGSQSMPRQQQAHVRRAETKVEPAQPRMSDMYMMIDDHLAWNMSSSNLESTRPGSSGTLFVDFDAAGDIEVSYRNGINKKLPTPPVPAKSQRTQRLRRESRSLPALHSHCATTQ